MTIKKKIIHIVAILILVIIGLLIYIYPQLDTNMKTKILDTHLQFNQDSRLSRFELSKIIELNLSNSNIENIKNLKLANNIKKLYLDRNPIKDINELKYLNKLEVLDLSKIEGLKYDSLSSLSNLRELYILLANIDDLSQIKTYQIKKLIISGNNIQNLNNIGKFKKLEVLYIDNNKIESIKNLNVLNKLELLDIRANNIKDYSVLLEMKSLKTLIIDKEQIEVFSKLDGFDNVEYEVVVEN